MTSADSSLRSGLLQRILTGAVLALILARAFVLGDDPGRLRLTAGAGSIVLTVLTFVALFLWAFQRGLHQLSDRRPGGLGIGLWLVAGWMFVRPLIPGEAAYDRPQWYFAWEWFTLAATVFLVRRVAATPDAARSLLSGIVAVVVAIAATGIAGQLSHKEPEKILLDRPASLPGTDEFVPEIDGPIAVDVPIRGTVDTPETFVQILLLLLPLAVAVSWAGFRDASLTGYALFALGAVVFAALLMAFAEFAQHPTADPGGGIPAGWRVLQTSPLTGVGGGNFSRSDPDFRSGASSAWLSFAGQFGIVALLVLVAIVAVGLIRMNRTNGIAPDPVVDPANEARVPWESYIGGIVGLLLGFVLSRWDVPAESPPRDVLAQGLGTGIRSLIWFAAFSLLERVALPTRTLLRCLSIGLVLAVACGTVSDSLLTLPLLYLFAILLALGINLACPPTPTVRVLRLPRAWLPFVLVLPLIPLYAFHVGTAGISTTNSIRQARKAGRLFPEKHLEVRRFDGAPVDKLGAVRKVRALTNAERFLDQLILGPLRVAVAADGRNAALHMELARWDRWRWEYLLDMREAEKAAQERNNILRRCEFAHILDPKNPAPLMAELEALLLFFDRSATDRAARLILFDKRLELLTAMRPVAEVPIRARLLQRLLEAHVPEVPEAEKPAQAEQIARIDLEAVRLWTLVRDGGAGSLSDAQSDWLKIKLRTVLAKPSPELLKLLGE